MALTNPNTISASQGKPDPHFYLKREELLQEIKAIFADGINEEQKSYFASEIIKLQKILDDPNPTIPLRTLQKEAIQWIITLLEQWLWEWYIKLPTGVGKTILFASIIQALWQPTLIMVPTKDLVQQTADTFLQDFGYDQDQVLVINPGNWITSTQACKKIVQRMSAWWFNWVVITTNPSLKNIYKKSPELFDQLKDHIAIYVTDEAHKSLWELHMDMKDNGLMSNADDLQKLHLLFTATPRMTQKTLDDYYRQIYGVTLQQAIDDKILVMPSYESVGKAQLNLDNDDEVIDNVTQEYLDKHCLKFVTDDGKFVYESLTDKYLDLKAQTPYGYAPGMAVCYHQASRIYH